MTEYHVVMTPDGLPYVVKGQIGADPEEIGRALTKDDGEKIAAELNRAGSAALRQRILDEVTDAIEGCFDG